MDRNKRNCADQCMANGSNMSIRIISLQIRCSILDKMMANYITPAGYYFYCRPTTCFQFGMGIDDWLRSMEKLLKKSRNVPGA